MADLALNDPATITGFARLVGVAVPVAHKLRDAYELPAGGTLHDWLLVYCERQRAVAAGRASEGGAELTRARIEQATADAEWKRMQIYERVGAVAESVRPLMEGWADAVQRAVMAAGSRIIEAVAESDGQIEPDVILGHLRTALRSAAGYPAGLDLGDDPGLGADDPADPDADRGMGEPVSAAPVGAS